MSGRNDLNRRLAALETARSDRDDGMRVLVVPAGLAGADADAWVEGRRHQMMGAFTIVPAKARRLPDGMAPPELH